LFFDCLARDKEIARDDFIAFTDKSLDLLVKFLKFLLGCRECLLAVDKFLKFSVNVYIGRKPLATTADMSEIAILAKTYLLTSLGRCLLI
jgi:hypothetical protein